uniref:Uncharacterized protein n=2 Tax=Caenorhabditis japonica TaxID=281687 RepID=A0A8R1ECC5_CAEJA
MRFLDCPKVYDHLYQKCPGYNKKDFWSSAHSCAGKSPDEIFKKFCWDEAKTLYNLLKTDFPFEDTVKTKSELLQREFAKIWHFLSGIGEPPVLRTLFGPFMNDLLNNLQSAWDSREKKDRKKFKAYSVDILAISGLLGSFDVLQNYTIPGQEKIAEFNSLLIIELYDRAGEPVVKLYHKPEEVTNEDHQLIDLTSSIRNCSSSDCPLEKFTGSCDAVRSTYEEIAKECVRKK